MTNGNLTSTPNMAQPTINKDAFLAHLVKQLTNLGVNLTPENGPNNCIELAARHHSELPARDGDWNLMLFPECHGKNLAEFKLVTSHFFDLENYRLEVLFD